MNRYLIIALGVAGLLVLGGIVMLGTWDVPAPTGTVETQIDGSRFSR